MSVTKADKARDTCNIHSRGYASSRAGVTIRAGNPKAATQDQGSQLRVGSAGALGMSLLFITLNAGVEFAQHCPFRKVRGNPVLKSLRQRLIA